jgi:hypothetical protein
MSFTQIPIDPPVENDLSNLQPVNMHRVFFPVLFTVPALAGGSRPTAKAMAIAAARTFALIIVVFILQAVLSAKRTVCTLLQRSLRNAYRSDIKRAKAWAGKQQNTSRSIHGKYDSIS